MFKQINKIIPTRLRMASWAIQGLYRSDRRPVLFQLLRKVKLFSLIDALACFIDEGGHRQNLIEIGVRGFRNPIKLRAQTSDFEVFVQVILNEQYAIKLPYSVEYILDAGANVGLTSVYFLERFPKAIIIAVEPDPDNFEMCKKNLAGYSNRVKLVNAAVYAENGFVAVSRNKYLDGREWATQVIPLNNNSEIVVPSKTVESLLREYSFPRIDLLKMDIEGSELSVFRDGDTGFLARTACCAVECHGEKCLQAFQDAVSLESFEVESSGELTVARRRR